MLTPNPDLISLPDVSKMTDEEFDAEIQKGLDDVQAGRTTTIQEMFDQLHKDIKQGK